MHPTTTFRPLALACALALFGLADSAAAQDESAPAAQEQVAPGQPASSAGRAARPRRDLITQEEIAQSGASNLYDVVQRLRPAWLRGTSASNIRGGGQGFVVYQNNTPLGGLDALRQMTPGYATAIRFLDGTEASNTLPGLGSRRVAGAIVVVTPGNR